MLCTVLDIVIAGLTRQSIILENFLMDARVKPAHDE
jgi:hypothetical protein